MNKKGKRIKEVRQLASPKYNEGGSAVGSRL